MVQVEIDEEDKAEAEAMPPEWSILADELDRLLDPARREAVEDRDDSERDRLCSLLAARWGGTG